MLYNGYKMITEFAPQIMVIEISACKSAFNHFMVYLYI